MPLSPVMKGNRCDRIITWALTVGFKKKPQGQAKYKNNNKGI